MELILGEQIRCQCSILLFQNNVEFVCGDNTGVMSHATCKYAASRASYSDNKIQIEYLILQGHGFIIHTI